MNKLSQHESVIPTLALKLFTDHLVERDYRPSMVNLYSAAANRFNQWLSENRLPLSAVDDDRIQRFLSGRPLRSKKDDRAALHQLVIVLRREDFLAPISDPVDEFEVPLSLYSTYLQSVCGVALSTHDDRLRYARLFLNELDQHGVALEQLNATMLIDFFDRYAQTHKPSSVRCLATALRSYLRFERLGGKNTTSLIAAIPTIACWPQSTLVKTLSEDEQARLLATFDQATPGGLRDYAMARCMLDLGLRASEVIQLHLTDIDWREGVLHLAAGKSRRASQLPLLPTTGEALARYLQTGRPSTSSSFVFLRLHAPFDAPNTVEMVRGAMRQAYRRAGFAKTWTGTHSLRHTAATRMLQRGASIKAVADVLGHRCLDTTVNYTRVDLTQLRTVALPWPEDQS